MDDTTRHLRAIFESGLDEGLRFLVCQRSNFAGRWFTSIEDGVAFAGERAPTDDVYIGMGMRRTLPPEGSRGLADEVEAIAGFWADVDVAGEGHKKAGLPATFDEARELIDDVGIHPSLVIMSGHGLQAYWLFVEPWIFADAADRLRAFDLSRRFAATVRAVAKRRGRVVDSVFDLSRVLRLAGTFNHKGGGRVPTAIVSEGPRCSLDDVDEILIAPELTPGEDGKPRVQFDVAHLILSEARRPPSDALVSLLTNHDRAKATWNRQRTDFADQSPSTYDFSLAVLGAKFGWTDQEIADLLISWRMRHGIEIKSQRGRIRLDYYQRTIANARHKVATELAANPYSAEVEATPLVGQDGRPADDDSRTKIIGRIRWVLDLPVSRVIQFGRGDEAVYSLTLDGGDSISLGRSAVLDSQKGLRTKLIPVARTLPKRLKAQAWDKFLREFLSVVEVVDNAESGRSAMFAALLTEYLVAKSSILRESDWSRAIATGDPFIRDGRLYLAAVNVEAWAKYHYTRKIDTSDLWSDLQGWGFVNTSENARVGGRKFGRRYWSATVDDLCSRHGFTLPLLADPSGETRPESRAMG